MEQANGGMRLDLVIGCLGPAMRISLLTTMMFPILLENARVRKPRLRRVGEICAAPPG